MEICKKSQIRLCEELTIQIQNFFNYCFIWCGDVQLYWRCRAKASRVPLTRRMADAAKKASFADPNWQPTFLYQAFITTRHTKGRSLLTEIALRVYCGTRRQFLPQLYTFKNKFSSIKQSFDLNLNDRKIKLVILILLFETLPEYPILKFIILSSSLKRVVLKSNKINLIFHIIFTYLLAIKYF